MTLRQYEAMFLFDPSFANDMVKVNKEVSRLMERAGAEVIMCDKWDERKLAYENKGHSRGVYLLTHFKMPGDSVDAFRADCRLEETILRQMMIRLEDDIPVYLEKSAKYYEKMRDDQDTRRGPRREGERDAVPAPEGDVPAAPATE